MGLGPNFRWRSGLPVNDERASIGFLEYRIDAAADGRFRYRGVDIDFQRYWLALRPGGVCKNLLQGREVGVFDRRLRAGQVIDRKSTRLNSSHVAISYAVFCLK